MIPHPLADRLRASGVDAWRERLVPQPDVPLVDGGTCVACGERVLAGDELLAGVWLEPTPADLQIPRRGEYVTHARCWKAALRRTRDVRASGRWQLFGNVAFVTLLFAAGVLVVHFLAGYLLGAP